MTETIQLIFQIIQWVGSLFGLIGGIILIMRFFKERPILKIDFFSTHEINEDDRTTIFSVILDLDNVGDKSTTIKTILFAFSDFEEKKGWHFHSLDFKIFNLNPRSSKRISKDFIVDEIINEHMKMHVVIDHTQGQSEKIKESFYNDVLPE